MRARQRKTGYSSEWYHRANKLVCATRQGLVQLYSDSFMENKVNQSSVKQSRVDHTKEKSFVFADTLSWNLCLGSMTKRNYICFLRDYLFYKAVNDYVCSKLSIKK